MGALPKSPPTRMTVEEFLDWPGDERTQLIDGEIVAMNPPGETHGTLQATLGRLLENYLVARRPYCRTVTGAGVVPRVRAKINVRIPDVAVTCAPPEANRPTLADPVMLVEILSPSNYAETWESVRAYTTIPSVREILVLESLRIEAHLLRRGADGNWPEDADVIAPGQELRLESIGFACPLAEIYARTHLAR